MTWTNVNKINLFAEGITDVYDVLALIAFQVVGTCTAGQQPNIDGVDIACCSSHFHNFLGGVVGSCSGPIDDEHPALMMSTRGHILGNICTVPLTSCSA